MKFTISRTCFFGGLATLCVGAPVPRPSATLASISVASSPMPPSPLLQGTLTLDLPAESIVAPSPRLDPESSNWVKECYASCIAGEREGCMPCIALALQLGEDLDGVDGSQVVSLSGAVAAEGPKAVEKRQDLFPTDLFTAGPIPADLVPFSPCDLDPERCLTGMDPSDFEALGDEPSPQDTSLSSAIAAQGTNAVAKRQDLMHASRCDVDPRCLVGMDPKELWDLGNEPSPRDTSSLRGMAAPDHQTQEKRQLVPPFLPFVTCSTNPELCDPNLDVHFKLEKRDGKVGWCLGEDTADCGLTWDNTYELWPTATGEEDAFCIPVKGEFNLCM